MPINRQLWKDARIDEANVPSHWRCPTCGTGSLAVVRDSFNKVTTERTHWAEEAPDWDPENWEGRFVGLLLCQNSRCQEAVAVTGTCGFTLAKNSAGKDQRYDYFDVTFFSPGLHLFSISPKCPPKVAGEI